MWFDFKNGPWSVPWLAHSYIKSDTPVLSSCFSLFRMVMTWCLLVKFSTRYSTWCVMLYKVWLFLMSSDFFFCNETWRLVSNESGKQEKNIGKCCFKLVWYVWCFSFYLLSRLWVISPDLCRFFFFFLLIWEFMLLFYLADSFLPFQYKMSIIFFSK